MKTLAELKNILQVGTKLKTLENNHGKYIGETAEITKRQTNGIYINRNGKSSWLEFPKASQVVFDGNDIFTFDIGFFKVKYQIIKGE